MIGQRKWPDQVQFRMTSAENIPRVLTFETRTKSQLGEQDCSKSKKWEHVR